MYMNRLDFTVFPKVITFFFTVFAVIATATTSAQTQDAWFKDLKKQRWLDPLGKIELLKATKLDLERELGRPEKLSFAGAEFIEYYTISGGRVTATFTTSECSNRTEKLIPKGVVEEISLEPNIDIKFQSLRLPSSKFKKTKDSDTPIYVFMNKRAGIEVEVQNGLVTNITFTVPKNGNLVCEHD